MNFIGRIEYFGSLIYDIERKEYIPLDQDATNILLNINNFNDINDFYYKYFSSKFNYLNFKSFISLAKSINLIDENNKSNVKFIENEDLEFFLANKFISSPLKINIALTYECLLKCRHCFSNSGKKTPQELQRELQTTKIISFLDELKENGIFYISFGGGEPLLKKDFIQIIKKANDNNMNISVSTSLIVNNLQEILEEIIKNNIKIQELKVSIEALNIKEYNNIRGKNSFEKLKENLTILQKYREEIKSKIRFSFVITKQNYTYLPSFLSFSEQHKVDSLTFIPIYNSGRARNYPELLLTPLELEKIHKIVDNMKERTKIDVEFLGIPMKTSGLYESYGCSCGKTTVYLSSTGDILPSGMFLQYQDRFSIGNITEKKLKEIWKENIEKEINKVPLDQKCSNCQYLEDCKGGCLFRTFDKYQQFGVKDPHCLIK
jgi:radical SAM protein with 4Fe4S-binding SPASM domain